ncbi:response regulator transcription factor [Leucobacter tardus]|uniref:Response regulator transcription factor n=1 Tax=Leucobacter tardus TaxID=501483 RepID=A0A939TUA8_9MICO|nr:response regulator transcription factor [Leucobacter tardus]MBO2989550.1 response regulator transcription factor [Leucobacter tardus]
MDLLIVEDDDAMAAALTDALRAAGHSPVRVERGADALLQHREVEMILLDLGLPDMDGLETMRKLRQITDAPVIVLTARDDERSVVRGLRLGADDYLVKPVRLAELLARIESVARRVRAAIPERREIVAGDLAIDLDGRTAHFRGRALGLTAKEFDLLALLAARAGSVVTREQILDALWGDAFAAVSRSLDVHLSGLRAKLNRPGCIVNVRGVGYRFDPETP